MLRAPRLICFSLSIVAAAAFSAGAGAAEPRYNVLLIMADDLRCATGCYGDRQAKTPHIDRLAARGVRFDRAYVQYPVCNPSRTSMLTSTRPEKNGVTGNGTFFRTKLPDVVTLPQLYRQHGGAADSYGKIFHAGLVEGETEKSMLDAGKSWDDAVMFRPTRLGNTGSRRNLTGGALKWCEVGAMEGTDDDQSDGQTTRHTIAAMERLGRKRWFLGAGYHRPHDPFVVNKRYVEMFPPGSLTLHRDPPQPSDLVPLAIGGGAFQQAFDKFTDDERMAFLTHYYAGASQTDAQVGRLLDALDRLKLWDHTIVVFVGDHGYHLGERNWWNKNTLFERSCRTPCVIVAPGVKPRLTASLVEFIDLYPTIAELCGLPAPSHVEGNSLVPLLNDSAAEVRDAAITYVDRGGKGHGKSIRTDRWRYTHWSDGAAELYDHRSDPEEWHNLAADPKLAAIVGELKHRLGVK
jgi:iduronate 2-sulfatase